MSTALTFAAAPNPAPYEGAHVQWEVHNYDDGSDVHWSAEPEGIVTIEPQDSHQHKAKITVRQLGYALITVTQHNRTSASRYVSANEILGYGPQGALIASQSPSWTLDAGVSGYNVALAWSGTHRCYALDIDRLNAIRGTDTSSTVYFNVAVASRTSASASGTPPALLIAAPDGSVWQSSDGGWQAVPPGDSPAVPSFSTMGPLAWAPPGPTPTEPSFNVTCYILNQPALDEARGSPDGTVYFTVTRVS